MEKAGSRLTVNASKCRGCRSCQLACSFVKHGLFNPLKSYIIMERLVETEHTTPTISEGCDLCAGKPFCAAVCPYGTIEFKMIT